MKNKINKEKVEAYFQNIYNNSKSDKKKKSLSIIYNILLNLYESSSVNFSIAHIGRLSKKEGGPSEPSIRNKQGKEYRELINFFKNNIVIVNNKEYDELDFTEYIEDPALKAHIKIIIAENKSLKNQLNILKNNMSKNYKLQYDTKTLTDINANSNTNLLSSEIDSIKRFIVDINSNKINLYKTAYGGLKDENETTIANAGFIDALEKIVKED